MSFQYLLLLMFQQRPSNSATALKMSFKDNFCFMRGLKSENS